MAHGSRARGARPNTGATRASRFSRVFGLGFWAFIFMLLYRLLRYFRGVQEIGPLLAGKLLGLILVGFFSILMLSNVITALSSFFLARDLDLLVSAPVDWFKLYVAKLLETLMHSSWMVVLHRDPDVHGVRRRVLGRTALSADRRSRRSCRFSSFRRSIGSAITLLLVNIFPARRTRDILSVIAVLAAGGVVVLFRLVRPGATRAARGISVARRLHHGAARPDVADDAERVGAARGDVVAQRANRICCPTTSSGRPPRPRSCSARCCTAGCTRGFSKAQESGQRRARSAAR